MDRMAHTFPHQMGELLPITMSPRELTLCCRSNGLIVRLQLSRPILTKSRSLSPRRRSFYCLSQRSRPPSIVAERKPTTMTIISPLKILISSSVCRILRRPDRRSRRSTPPPWMRLMMMQQPTINAFSGGRRSLQFPALFLLPFPAVMPVALRLRWFIWRGHEVQLMRF